MFQNFFLFCLFAFFILLIVSGSDKSKHNFWLFIHIGYTQHNITKYIIMYLYIGESNFVMAPRRGCLVLKQLIDCSNMIQSTRVFIYYANNILEKFRNYKVSICVKRISVVKFKIFDKIFYPFSILRDMLSNT